MGKFYSTQYVPFLEHIQFRGIAVERDVQFSIWQRAKISGVIKKYQSYSIISTLDNRD